MLPATRFSFSRQRLDWPVVDYSARPSILLPLSELSIYISFSRYSTRASRALVALFVFIYFVVSIFRKGSWLSSGELLSLTLNSSFYISFLRFSTRASRALVALFVFILLFLYFQTFSFPSFLDWPVVDYSAWPPILLPLSELSIYIYPFRDFQHWLTVL